MIRRLPSPPSPCAALLAGGLLVLAACGSTPPGDEVTPAPPPPVRWTQRFAEESVLVCDRLLIEGPEDLLAHVVVPQNEELFDYSVKTTPRGLRQVVQRKPGAGGATIRGQIDNWRLVVFERLEVVQRPGEVPVHLIAEGKAAWIPADGSRELRDSRLEFTGERE